MLAGVLRMCIMLVHYKCDNCGADMGFDSDSGTLHCSSCGAKNNIEEMAGDSKSKGKSTYEMEDEDKRFAKESFEHDYEDSSDRDEPTDHSTFQGDEARQYQCNNCGANLITDAQTTATRCSFCGAGVVLGDRLSGSYAPAKVIPFSISKEQAQDAFRKWCKRGLLTPGDFMTADRIKNIQGLYVPFWLYDLNGRGEINATCTRVSTYTRGDWIYTKTKYYNVFRKVDLNYLNVPCDASKKMDDKTMDKLEPYRYDNLKSFSMPYLTGYIAEKYDYDDNELLPRVKNRVNSYVNSYITSTITGYTSVKYNRKEINVRQKQSYYTLLPVWMISYDYKKADHTFAMNGQTGKVVGRPPLSKGKILAWFAGISTASFVILQLISFITGGGF